MEYIPRRAEKLLDNWLNSKKVLILLGARQVGKTTLISRLLNRHPGKIFNLDAEVDKAQILAAKSLSPPEALKILGNPPILAIDEAQRLPEIGRIAKGWFDKGVRAKIILSGSSSLNLINQTAEPLTGRNEKIYLPPLLFAEILEYQDWYPAFARQPAALQPQLQALLRQSLVFGSYPEAVTNPEKEKYLQNLSADYLLKDILSLGTVKNPDFLKKLLFLLSRQIGSLVSVNELAANLGASRQTVEKYLDLLEETLVIFRLGSYSTNLRKEIARSKKIYFWDNGIRNALIKEFSLPDYRSDIGQIWENWVVAEIAKQNLLTGNLADLYFWRSRNGAEVDLIIKQSGLLTPLEIKWSSRKNYGSRAFSAAYKIRPKIITKDNFLKMIHV